jgi:hypothetical protein
MFKASLLCLILFLILGGAVQKKRPPKVIRDNYIVVLLSISSLSVCDSKSSCKPGERVVDLTANAIDPERNELFYEWTVDAGIIKGEGRSVRWNLTDVPVGAYTVRVSVKDGNAHSAEAATKVEVVDCGNCDSAPLEESKQANRPPKIDQIIPSQNSLSLCPFSASGTCDSGSTAIQIRVNATDPDGDKLQFDCKVSGGQLSKCGSEMSWELSNVPRMDHRITVKVSDGRGGEDESSIKVTVLDCGTCDPPAPPCPRISLSTDGTTKNQVRVTLKLDGAETIGNTTFVWKASAGKIIRGQNTREVVVNTTELEAEDLTIEVLVGGLDPSCSNTASARLLINPD